MHAARFSRPYGADDGNTSEQAPLRDDEPPRIFRRHLPPRMVKFADDEEKIGSFPGDREREAIGPLESGCFALSAKMYNPESKTE